MKSKYDAANRSEPGRSQPWFNPLRANRGLGWRHCATRQQTKRHVHDGGGLPAGVEDDECLCRFAFNP